VTKIPSSAITDKRLYLNRRAFMASALAAAGAAVIVDPRLDAQQPAAHGRRLATVKSPLSGSDSPNTWEHLTTYNNFYEFGTGKSDPALNARGFKPKEPWSISVEGECAKPGTLNLEDVLKGQTLEDRIYRHRCVEGWSMVIPWVGFPLAALIKRCEPTSRAAFVGEVRDEGLERKDRPGALLLRAVRAGLAAFLDRRGRFGVAIRMAAEGQHPEVPRRGAAAGDEDEHAQQERQLRFLLRRLLRRIFRCFGLVLGHRAPPHTSRSAG